MIRHVIFDLDGTLVDSCGLCVGILTAMLRDRGSDHTIDVNFARPFMSHGGERMIAALLGPACGNAAAELADFRTRYEVTTTPVQALFAGVGESLASLRDAGVRMAICSNKPQNLCEQVLEDTGLTHFFDVVVGRRPGLQPKPAMDLLEVTLDELGANPEGCLFVGDSALDKAVADAASIPFIFLSYGYAEAGWVPYDSDQFDCFIKMTSAIVQFANGNLPNRSSGSTEITLPRAAEKRAMMRHQIQLDSCVDALDFGMNLRP